MIRQASLPFPLAPPLAAGSETPSLGRRGTVAYLELAVGELLNRVTSPRLPFAWTINPYRGCEHGCIYCYARPNHGYVGLSPGLDFESRLFARIDAAERLHQELATIATRQPTVSFNDAQALQPAEPALES